METISFLKSVTCDDIGTFANCLTCTCFITGTEEQMGSLCVKTRCLETTKVKKQNRLLFALDKEFEKIGLTAKNRKRE